MAERSNEQKNFFKNLHTDQYKWNDFFLIPLIVTIVMMFVGQTGVLVISKILMKPIINDNNVDFLTIFQQYLTFLGVWIIALLYCYFTQKNRPIIKALTPFCKGNSIAGNTTFYSCIYSVQRRRITLQGLSVSETKKGI